MRPKRAKAPASRTSLAYSCVSDLPSAYSLPVLPVPMRSRIVAIFNEAEALLRSYVRDVGVVAVLLNAEDVTAIAADGKQTTGLRREGVDDVIFAGPDFAWGLVWREGIDLSAFRRGGACVGSLQRAWLDDGEGNRSNALHGEEEAEDCGSCRRRWRRRWCRWRPRRRK